MAPQIARLDQEIEQLQNTVEATAGRLQDRESATRTVIERGLEDKRYASKLAERIAAERNQIDRVPSVADLRPVTRQQSPHGVTEALHAETAVERTASPDL